MRHRGICIKIVILSTFRFLYYVYYSKYIFYILNEQGLGEGTFFMRVSYYFLPFTGRRLLVVKNNI